MQEKARAKSDDRRSHAPESEEPTVRVRDERRRGSESPRREEDLQTYGRGRSMMPFRPDELSNWPFGWHDFSALPFEMMRRFTRDLDRMFEDFGAGRSRGGLAMWMPRAEVVQRDDQLVVRFELPGLEKNDVHVRVESNGLVIEGERRMEEEDRTQGRFQSEVAYGHFYRQIPLPEGVTAEQVEARFKNGILEVTIPNPQGRQREIPIEG